MRFTKEQLETIRNGRPAEQVRAIRTQEPMATLKECLSIIKAVKLGALTADAGTKACPHCEGTGFVKDEI